MLHALLSKCKNDRDRVRLEDVERWLTFMVHAFEYVLCPDGMGEPSGKLVALSTAMGSGSDTV